MFTAWYHHITLSIMALHFMLDQRIRQHQEIPLLSCPDIKLFMALLLERKVDDPSEAWELLQARHKQRKADRDRCKPK